MEKDGENMNDLKLSRVQQAFEMIEALGMHSVDIEVAVCRHIGRPNETVLIKKWDPKLMGWFAFENVNTNSNIWVRPNPEIDHPWLLLDDLAISEARKLARKYQCIVVETSAGNCQVRLLANINLSREQRKLIQIELVKSYILRGINADAGSTAGCKWSRLPGFRNRKPNRDCWTNLLSIPNENLPKFNPTPYLSVDFSSAVAELSVSPVKKTIISNISMKKRNQFKDGIDRSGLDFGYLYGRLKFYKETGRDYMSEAKKLEDELCNKTHKRNPEFYAKITVENALKRL